MSTVPSSPEVWAELARAGNEVEEARKALAEAQERLQRAEERVRLALNAAQADLVVNGVGSITKHG